MSLGRFILTVLVASMLAGCAGTVARDRTSATGEPSARHAKSAAAGQAANEASLPPRARKRPKITGKPHQTAIQDTKPAKKRGAGASSGGAASSPQGAAGPPAGSGKLAGAGAGTASAGMSPSQDSATGVSADSAQMAASGAGNSSADAPSGPDSAAETSTSSGQLALSDDGIFGDAPTIVSPPGVATDADGANAETDDPGEPGGSPQIAILQPGSKVGDRSKAADLPKPPSFRERSLNCDVIELMGKYIGQRHIRGEPRVEATDRAIDDVLRQTGGERDDRFVFSGRVYGMLIYRLERNHSVEGYSAYARSACQILRGGKGIVPADKNSEYQLNEALRICESGFRKGDELYSCISRRMEKVVQKRDY